MLQLQLKALPSDACTTVCQFSFNVNKSTTMFGFPLHHLFLIAARCLIQTQSNELEEVKVRLTTERQKAVDLDDQLKQLEVRGRPGSASALE